MTFQYKLKYSLGDMELWARHCARQRKKDRHWQVRFHEADNDGFLPRYNAQTPLAEQLGSTATPYSLKDYL